MFTPAQKQVNFDAHIHVKSILTPHAKTKSIPISTLNSTQFRQTTPQPNQFIPSLKSSQAVLSPTPKSSQFRSATVVVP